MAEYSKAKILHLSFISEIVINGILQLLLLIRIIAISKIGVFSRTQLKWTNLFFIKLLLSILLTLNYGSISISINPIEYHKVVISNCFNSIVWLFASVLLYFEYLRQLNQSWLSLRLFYFIHFAVFLSKICLQLIYSLSPFHLFSCIVFGLLLTPMLIFSLCFEYNSFENRDKTFAPGIDEITSNFLQNDSGNNSRNNPTQDIIEISISEKKSLTFHQKGDLLIPLTMPRYNDSKNIKLRFVLKILISDNEERYQYSKKQTIQSIKKFNQKSLLNIERDSFENRQAYIACYSEIVQAIQSISNALMQKEGMNSSIDLRDKFSVLELNYAKLCRSKMFLRDFFAFLSFDNKEIVDNIINAYSLLTNSQHINNECTSSSFIDLKESADSNELLYRDDNIVDVDNVISQLTLNEIMFVNEVLKTTNHIALTIDADSYVNEAIKCKIKTETVAYSIQIPIQELFNYISYFTSKAKSKSKAKSVYMILSNEECLSQIVSGKLKEEFKLNLEGLLSNILNDLFYFNETSFALFNLNKIIVSYSIVYSI